MKLIISTHFYFLSKIVKAFLLIKCHAKGFARERGEAEWRFPLTKNGLLGGVVFGNATTVSREEITIGEETVEKLNLFEAVRPAGGFGLRVLLNRTGRLNLGLDMAWGDNGAKGFYFVVGETF